jgi:hypothetical protein
VRRAYFEYPVLHNNGYCPLWRVFIQKWSKSAHLLRGAMLIFRVDYVTGVMELMRSKSEIRAVLKVNFKLLYPVDSLDKSAIQFQLEQYDRAFKNCSF